MVIRPESWLEEAFASPAQVRLLRVLTRDPQKYWTGREAARAAGLPQSTASVVLRRLRDLQLLDIRQAGPSHLFRLRPDLASTERMCAVFGIEADTLPTILESVRAALPPKVTCYLFGSTARKTAGRGSDLDLLIAADRQEEADEAAAAARAALRADSPLSIDVIALPRSALKTTRNRKLLQNVLQDGRHVAGPRLKERAA